MSAPVRFQTLLRRAIPGDFFEVIKDGILLCQVMNALKAGTIASINEKRSTVATTQYEY